jgi:hypothetical protein
MSANLAEATLRAYERWAPIRVNSKNFRFPVEMMFTHWLVAQQKLS